MKCRTPKSQCPAFDERFNTCGLGFAVEEKEKRNVWGLEMRYYGSVGRCKRPKSLSEYVNAKMR